jgi:thymidylate synthase
LEKLDWFFTSNDWTINYPSTFVFPLFKPTLDHLPCVVATGTKIPRAKIFKFENYWLQHSSFKEIVENAWKILVEYSNSAKRVNAKFKNLRRAISLWAKNLPCLKKQIEQVNSVIELLDIFEESRPLKSYEWNLRDLLKSDIITLLQNQKSY